VLWFCHSLTSIAIVTVELVPSLFAPGPIRSPEWIGNRTLTNSLPGTFAPRPFRSLEGKFYRTFVPWNFRSLNVSIAVYFRCLTLTFMPITQCEDQNIKMKKVQPNGHECINKIPNYEQNSTQSLSVLQKIGLRDFRSNACTFLFIYLNK